MSELAAISYSVFMAVLAMVVIFFSVEDDDQNGGKMIPIPLKQ